MPAQRAGERGGHRTDRARMLPDCRRLVPRAVSRDPGRCSPHARDARYSRRAAGRARNPGGTGGKKGERDGRGGEDPGASPPRTAGEGGGGAARVNADERTLLADRATAAGRDVETPTPYRAEGNYVEDDVARSVSKVLALPEVAAPPPGVGKRDSECDDW